MPQPARFPCYDCLVGRTAPGEPDDRHPACDRCLHATETSPPYVRHCWPCTLHLAERSPGCGCDRYIRELAPPIY